MNIVIEIEGGMVQRVISDEPITGKVMVLDRDEEDEDRPTWSKTFEASVEPVPVHVDGHAVSGVIKEWEVV